MLGAQRQYRDAGCVDSRIGRSAATPCGCAFASRMILSILLSFPTLAKNPPQAPLAPPVPESGPWIEPPPTPLPEPAVEREPGLMRMLHKTMPCPVGTQPVAAGRSLAESLEIDTLADEDKRAVLDADYDIFSEAMPTTRLSPQYPRQALESGLSGRVWVAALIAADGRVMRASTLCSSDSLFDAAAAEAMRAMRFRIAPAGGEAGPMLVFQSVRFELMEEGPAQDGSMKDGSIEDESTED
jgi:TonB family protein